MINWSYVKVDIEGFELHFMNGAEGLLKRKAIDIIQLEINNQLENSNTKIADLLSAINQYGYQLCKYNVNSQIVEKIEYTEDRENYFAVSSMDLVNHNLKMFSL